MIQGGRDENYDAAGIRGNLAQFEVAAGFEPHARCNVSPVVLLPVNVKNKRAVIISIRRPVACHISIRSDFLKFNKKLMWFSIHPLILK